MEQDILNRVKQAKLGDKEALIELIMSQRQDFYRLAYIYMKDQEDALDAMEDMTLKVFENIKGLKDAEAFFSWSKIILVNCCKQNLRKRNKVILLQELPEESYEEPISEHEERMAFEAHIAELNPKYQEALRLRFILDMDYETIANLLKIPLGTVKSRIHTGLQKLKHRMEVEQG
ncbi:RNA polymerase sigma factor, sigma-70 family [Desulfitobacterium dichloroeliminans LMG P-21439]|uniref:RNA polymerase sigma factor, sigma-70 family n=1 Tax=Desulfitobacterium dichloroeliminans (strain LMG P-21439 / DCA1) TaxID=871963 RepID=L0FB94_DESDL|nr:sigma-70 family RNA polymerase sigma factor [Desulfitobacterium dichloroeliminans]AGA69926.1 RNA polymerase sigma factor, sigma-70 family [Desulfitobacterium dichloroeliminans LMG P-21439]